MDSTKLGVKTTDNIFVYPMIGFNSYLVYERDKNIISAYDDKTGRVINERELSWIYRNMNFDDFVVYAKNCFLHNINMN